MPSRDDLILKRTHNRLPRWSMTGSVYFVTWALSDRTTALTDLEKNVVAAAFKHFHTQRYNLVAYVVMDDHIHLLVHPCDGFALSEILHSWKSYTSHAIQKSRGSTGAFWQKDSHTRIIRNEAELRQKAGYILSNPSRRWGDVAHYAWVELVSWPA